MAERIVSKSLAGLEDLLLGNGTEQQIRNGYEYPITKLSLPWACSDIAELLELDTTKFTQALVSGIAYKYDGSAWVKVSDNTLRSELAAPDGAGLVGYQASPVASAVRTVSDKLGEMISVKDFGAVGDFNPATLSGSDDTAAFQAAALSGIKRIAVPAGSYKISSKINFTTPVSFIGITPELSRLFFFDCDGFSYQLPSTIDNAAEIRIERLSLLTTTAGTRTGIHASMKSGTGSPVSVCMDDVLLAGADVFDAVPGHVWPGQSRAYALEWKTAVDGNDCDNFIFKNGFIRGNSYSTSNGFVNQVTGIKLTGVTYSEVSNNRFYFMHTSTILTGQGEGFRFFNNDVVACYRGVGNEGTTSPSNHYTIYGNHFSVRKVGVFINTNTSGATVRTGQHFIFSNFILKRNEPNEPLYPLGEPNYVAVQASCSLSHIYDNHIQNNVPNTDIVSNGDVGIAADGNDLHIHSNSGYNSGTFITLSNETIDAKVVGNSITATGTSTGVVLRDDGSQNTVEYGNTSTEDRTRGTFPIQSNVRIGNNLVASTKFLDVLTSGMNDIYDTRFEFLGGGASTGSGEVRVRAGTFYSLAANALFASVVKPNTDNTFALGLSTARWSTVYAGTGTINTSDAREKTPPTPIDDAALDAWGDVQLVTFQWLSAIHEKGADTARWHFGVVAQQVRDAFIARGLDGTRYGLLCYDEWADEFEDVIDDEGNKTGEQRLVLVSGNRWGIRPDQCLFLEAALQRRNYQRLLARIEALESV